MYRMKTRVEGMWIQVKKGTRIIYEGYDRDAAYQIIIKDSGIDFKYTDQIPVNGKWVDKKERDRNEI